MERLLDYIAITIVLGVTISLLTIACLDKGVIVVIGVNSGVLIGVWALLRCVDKYI